MPKPDGTKEPWEELGFESFSAYTVAQDAKFATLTQTTEALQADLAKKAEKPVEKTAEEIEAERVAAEKKEKERKENAPVTEDQYKVKATTLYASLSDEQRKEAEAVGSVFGDLKSQKKKLSPTELIRAAMTELRAGSGNPERRGSGFVPKKDADGKIIDAGTEPGVNIMDGLYGLK